MKVIVFDQDGERTLEVLIESDLVMNGGAWHEGVRLAEQTFTAECVMYALNEGGVLADSWASEDTEGVVTRAFVVSEVTSAELGRLRRLNAALPAGGHVTTVDGCVLAVTPGGALVSSTGASLAVSDLADGWRLTARLEPVLAAFFLKEVESWTTDMLDDWYEKHVGYRLSVDDPSLVGSVRHGEAVAEMMCLHQFGEGAVYAELLRLLGE